MLLMYWAFKCYITLIHQQLPYSFTHNSTFSFYLQLQSYESSCTVIYAMFETKLFMRRYCLLLWWEQNICELGFEIWFTFIVVSGRPRKLNELGVVHCTSLPQHPINPFQSLIGPLNNILIFLYHSNVGACPTHILLVYLEQLCCRRSETMQDVVHIYANRKCMWNNLCHWAGKLGFHLQTWLCMALWSVHQIQWHKESMQWTLMLWCGCMKKVILFWA